MFGWLDIACAVLLLEPFDSTSGIDKLLLAGIERMAHRADFRVNFFCGTAGLKRIPTTAFNLNDIVFGMYIFFHSLNSPFNGKQSIIYI